MKHRLVESIEKALGWSGPERIGAEFAYGSMPDAMLCDRLLTPPRLLDLVMRRSMAPHRLRCLVDGADVHPQDYITMSAARRGQSVPMADMRRLANLIESGCTLVVDQTNTYDPTMEVACRALQWWSHELVQVNTYLTTGETSGFELHWDDHDVIVVQLAGEKSWEVRGLARPAPLYRDAVPNPDPPDEIMWSGMMRAGDAVHIPRGYWHRATRREQGTGYSLHATFGIHKRTGVDWVEWLADETRKHDLFRHDLNQWGTADERCKQHNALSVALREVADKSPFADYLTARAQRPSARHVATRGVFGPPKAVVCVTEFPPVVHTAGDSATVSVVGTTIRFAAAALPALRVLLSGAPVNVSDLAESTGVDVDALASVLIAEEICVEVTPGLAAGYADLVATPAQ